jgi:hypothetical protein
LAVTEPAVALKAADVEPTPTVTEGGNVITVLLSERFTDEPPLGAERDRVTVHVEAVPETAVLGEHCNAETAGRTACTAMVPPVPVTAMAFPLVEDPTRLPIATGTVALLVADSVNVTTTTTPLLI